MKPFTPCGISARPLLCTCTWQSHCPQSNLSAFTWYCPQRDEAYYSTQISQWQLGPASGPGGLQLFPNWTPWFSSKSSESLIPHKYSDVESTGSAFDHSQHIPASLILSLHCVLCLHSLSYSNQLPPEWAPRLLDNSTSLSSPSHLTSLQVLLILPPSVQCTHPPYFYPLASLPQLQGQWRSFLPAPGFPIT